MIKKNMEWETAEFRRHFKREYNEFKMFINGELKHRIRLENFGRLKFFPNIKLENCEKLI